MFNEGRLRRGDVIRIAEDSQQFRVVEVNACAAVIRVRQTKPVAIGDRAFTATVVQTQRISPTSAVEIVRRRKDRP